MKISLLTLMLCCVTMLAASQEVHKYRASEFSVTKLMENGKWSEWSKPEKDDALFVFNDSKKSIKVYGPGITKSLDAVTYNPPEKQKDGSTLIKIDCVDDDGSEIAVLVQYDEYNNRKVYIRHETFMLMFTVNPT